jgi:hypothetical protein
MRCCNQVELLALLVQKYKYCHLRRWQRAHFRLHFQARCLPALSAARRRSLSGCDQAEVLRGLLRTFGGAVIKRRSSEVSLSHTEQCKRQLWRVTRCRPTRISRPPVVMTQEEFVCLIGGLDNHSTVMPDGSRVVSRLRRDLFLFIRFLPELHNKQA